MAFDVANRRSRIAYLHAIMLAPGLPRTRPGHGRDPAPRPAPGLRPRLPPRAARGLRLQRARPAPLRARRLPARGRAPAGVLAPRRLGRRDPLRPRTRGPRARSVAVRLSARSVTVSAQSARHGCGFRLYARKRVVGRGAPEELRRSARSAASGKELGDGRLASCRERSRASSGRSSGAGARRSSSTAVTPPAPAAATASPGLALADDRLRSTARLDTMVCEPAACRPSRTASPRSSGRRRPRWRTGSWSSPSPPAPSCSASPALAPERTRGALMELIHTCYRIPTLTVGRVLRGARLRGAPAAADHGRGRQHLHGLPGDDDRLELTYNFGVDAYELGTAYGPRRHGRRHPRDARPPLRAGDRAGEAAVHGARRRPARSRSSSTTSRRSPRARRG